LTAGSLWHTYFIVSLNLMFRLGVRLRSMQLIGRLVAEVRPTTIIDSRRPYYRQNMIVIIIEAMALYKRNQV
jgi:hypothetical protein